MIPLTLVSPVASTTTGMWSRLWTWWYSVALLTFGSTRLSSIRLTFFPANSLRFLLLAVVVDMLHFLCASRHISGLWQDLLLLMTRTCATAVPSGHAFACTGVKALDITAITSLLPFRRPSEACNRGHVSCVSYGGRPSTRRSGWHSDGECGVSVSVRLY